MNDRHKKIHNALKALQKYCTEEHLLTEMRGLLLSDDRSEEMYIRMYASYALLLNHDKPILLAVRDYDERIETFSDPVWMRAMKYKFCTEGASFKDACIFAITDMVTKGLYSRVTLSNEQYALLMEGETIVPPVTLTNAAGTKSIACSIVSEEIPKEIPEEVKAYLLRSSGLFDNSEVPGIKKPQ